MFWTKTENKNTTNPVFLTVQMQCMHRCTSSSRESKSTASTGLRITKQQLQNIQNAQGSLGSFLSNKRLQQSSNCLPKTPCCLSAQQGLVLYVLQVFLLFHQTQNDPEPKSKQLKTYMLQRQAGGEKQKCLPLFPHSWRIQLSACWTIAIS